ncbi:PEP-CTERM protein-sorting domain-containing protein/MYXO-CTERM domain-containing protein [Rubritalea squalenifaciens DSM 18772]|uniref:PEP-CTERM protein-sorting domain-containing protein/MYXO-CTERM domain-containing protein n=1 Tax=Rubritalea squalenifaciens DSM 18772 TaxID=1123071 RepID=A0A1M6PPY3_9BACT|nr:PEP-CTERM sorting domain-containing protein [Rubritalea squalenifaciens]SHK10010.1 PEP-CTERM protein-sorting domain-containing protein/MYXO-CTERM domain-containing protein [Rubritalea squalenifaciens DSM 18772]
MKKTLITATLLTSAGLANAATIINVVNSGFEDQVLADGLTTRTADGGDGTITGWTESNTADHLAYVTNPSNTGANTANNDAETILPLEGSNAAFFQNSSISQTLSGFDIKTGDIITVEFDLWRVNGGGDTFRIDFGGIGETSGTGINDGTIGGDMVTDAGPERYSVDFIATSDITAGDLVFRSTAGGNRYLLDDVVVTYSTAAVPEPSSTALIGLAGLGFILRRRR